ncbi:uncharacterized protein Dvar_07100 [Desulfosarcina variabilis str. Montpellier]
MLKIFQNRSARRAVVGHIAKGSDGRDQLFGKGQALADGNSFRIPDTLEAGYPYLSGDSVTPQNITGVVTLSFR